MKLLRLRVAGFGPLRGEWSFSPDKVNVVVDDNERGKTTVLSAIAAALYGLEDDRRSHRVLTPLERWRPWTGGGFGVELELRSGGRTLSIARDFERGTVTVFDDQGKEVTGEFVDGKDVPVGQRLLGVDAAEFEKCALVRQGDLDAVVPGDEKARRVGMHPGDVQKDLARLTGDWPRRMGGALFISLLSLDRSALADKLWQRILLEMINWNFLF